MLRKYLADNGVDRAVGFIHLNKATISYRDMDTHQEHTVGLGDLRSWLYSKAHHQGDEQ